MDLEKLKPWNWFKHEEGDRGHQVPVARADVAGLTQGRPGSLSQLHREMDRWFDEAFRGFGMPASGSGSAAAPLADLAAGVFRPRVDVSGDQQAYRVQLDVPGMSEDDLSLEVSDDRLVIKGRKEERKEDKDRHFYRVERSYGSFQRTLCLPDDADADGISANLDKGVLRLEIPRRAEAGKDVKRIAIGS